jgi:hypothetical protein
MFNIDREELKNKINDSINSHYAQNITEHIYISGSGSNSHELADGFNNIIRGLDARIQNQIKQAFEIHTKTMLRDVMSDLIDSLYTADDFEKDLELK